MSYLMAGALTLTVTKDSNESAYAYDISQPKERFQHLGDMYVVETAVNQEFDLTPFMTTVEELWIISDKAITVRLNADTNFAIACKKLIISEGSITKLFITNAGSGAATIQIFAGG
jgi:hypothetical protein